MSTAHRGQYKFLKYKWEFLRRNKDYISESKELCNILNSGEYWGMIWDSDPKPELADFCKKWNIDYPLDPSFSYDDYSCNKKIPMKARKHLQRFLSWKPRVRVLDSSDFMSYKDLNRIAIAHRLDKELFHNGKLIVEIDLDYSKSQLKRSVETLIDYQQKALKSRRVDAGKSEKSKSKKHYDNYDYYLVVYDLRKAGRSWSQVREALRMNGIKSAEIQTARDYYKAANRLVREGLSL